MKYVLGDNFVSYFVSYILGLKLVKYKSLEDLDLNHGQDAIPPNLLEVCKKLFSDCVVLEYERFYDDRGKCTSNRPKNFYKLYCLYTRGKTNVEKSYLKQLNKYQRYVSINGNDPEKSYEILFDKIKESVNKNCIDETLVRIDLGGKLVFSDRSIEFDRLISTINIVDLVELDNSGKIRQSIVENNKLDGFHLPHNDKFTYICKLRSEEDKILSGIYKQILATGRPYFRKTYVEDHVFYDCMRNIYDDKIEGNEVVKYVETTQISDNLDIKKVMGIDMVGKFAQWKEGVNLETIYNDCQELKEFYESSEKNHKKVF
jgi:hypothetical protein